MTFANPVGLWLAALAVPIILLHVLRPRRPELVVSSTYLWRPLASPVSAAQPWQRLRPSVLLALQLLAALLLALAVARPLRTTDAPLAEHTVFVVDASGSMAAGDGEPDRLGAAKAEARRLRDQLPEGAVASVVVASPSPRVLLSTSADDRAFDEALDPVEASAGGADFAAAFSLAESLETPGVELGVVLFSDGRLGEADRRLLPPGTRYVRVGERSTNRGLARLSVEPRGAGLHARVNVRHTGGPAAIQTLRIDVDERTVHTAELTLEPGAVLDHEADLPAGDRIEAFLEGEDLLDADDHAYAVAARRRALRVLVAGPDDPFLDAVLAATPGVQVERSPASIPASGFDLAIYDGVDVPADPQAPFLAIAPPAGLPGVSVIGAVERPAVTLVRSDDALVEGLDLSAIGIAAAQRVEAPTAEVVVAAEGAPLLLRGSAAGRPFAYLSFPLAQSNLPLSVGFPILVDRLLTDLAGAPPPPTGLVVGDPLPLPVGGAAATVTAPGGTSAAVAPGSPAPLTTRPGFWTVAVDGRADRVVAVNAEPEESVLAPVAELPVRPRSPRGGGPAPVGELPLLRWVLVLLVALLGLEWLAGRRARGVGRVQWRLATALRLGVAGLVVAALLGVTLSRPATRVATVFVLDASDSMAGVSGEASGFVRDALAGQPDGALAGVALFGGEARLELTMQEDAALGVPAVDVDASRTDLAAALRLAGAVLPADARRRVVLVSDGRATTGDAATEAARLAEHGIELDVHPLGGSVAADVAIERLEAPALARTGEEVSLEAVIVATSAGPATLTLRWEGEVVEERVVELRAGENRVPLPQVAGAGGLARYSVEMSSPDDGVAPNNVGYAAVQVEGPAAVLVAEGMPGMAETLAAALRSGGLEVEVVPASGIPALDRLSTYAATVLVDVDSRALSSDQVAALAAATRDLGRGLVVLGGDRSYGLGGYLDSELEELLPVVSEVVDPRRRQSVAEVLAIDTSESMGACHCAEGATGPGGLPMGGNISEGGVNKTDISRAAAARTIEALSDTDEIGVLAINTEEQWVIDLQALPSEEVVSRGLRSLRPFGGTDLSRALATSAQSLRESDASLKHIILFTDGFTAPEVLDGMAVEAGRLAEEGITVSVLATGEGAAEQLAAIAEAGRGRFYPGRDLAEVPQIMTEEALLASRSVVNEGEFVPEVTGSGPVVDRLQEAPPLLGYLATSAKPTATTSLRVGAERDPLLASWQVGLGRATSWTSDASARWSQLWAGWDGYVDFWTGVVKESFLSGGTSGGSVRARVADDVLSVSVESESPWPDGAVATARVAGPDLDGQEVRLERTSDTSFAAEIPVDRAGTYAIGASVSGPAAEAGAEPLVAGTALATQSYSVEYRPGQPEPETLLRLSEATGGRGAIAASQAFDADGLEPGVSRVALTGWLLLAAALLWPAAVALGRLRIGRGRPVRAGAGPALRWLHRRAPRPPGPRRPPRPPRPRSDRGGGKDSDGFPRPTLERLLASKRSRADPGD